MRPRPMPPLRPAEDAPDPRIGTIVAGYRIEGLLGHGATGSVYRAVRIALDLPVALKLLRPEASDPAFRARFEQEARCAAAIRHPGVVQVYDAGMCDGCNYLAVELVEGSTLSQVLADRLVLPPDEAVRVMVRVLDALAALADAGLVHRDVKPDNIMIGRDGQVKLIDLGLARSRWSDVSDGRIVGTPAYMPPEQWLGSAIDHRADQFSLGVTGYLAMSGQRPWAGASPLALLEAMRAGRPLPLHRAAAGVGESLSAVLMRMLAFEAALRWPDHRSCAAALVQNAGTSRTPRPGRQVTVPVQTPETTRITRRIQRTPAPYATPRSALGAPATTPSLDVLGEADRLAAQGDGAAALALLERWLAATSGAVQRRRLESGIARIAGALDEAALVRARSLLAGSAATGSPVRMREAMAMAAEVRSGLRLDPSRAELDAAIAAVASRIRRLALRRAIAVLVCAIAAAALWFGLRR